MAQDLSGRLLLRFLSKGELQKMFWSGLSSMELKPNAPAMSRTKPIIPPAHRGVLRARLPQSPSHRLGGICCVHYAPLQPPPLMLTARLTAVTKFWHTALSPPPRLYLDKQRELDYACPQSDGESEAQSLSKVGPGAPDFLSLEQTTRKSPKVSRAATAARHHSVVTSGQVLLLHDRKLHGEGLGLRAGGASLIHELLAEAQS